MQYDHDNMTGAMLSADLVNLTAGGQWSVDSAHAVLVAHEIRRAALVHTSSEHLRAWSMRIRAVFEAPDVRARCATINELLADGTARTYLTTHDGWRPHLHFAPDDEDIVGRVKAVTAGGLAIFTVEAEGRRLGACTLDGCRRVFVDISRNGRRAYCSPRCGNTDAVRRHRDHAPVT